jgi:hypothetical protein
VPFRDFGPIWVVPLRQSVDASERAEVTYVLFPAVHGATLQTKQTRKSFIPVSQTPVCTAGPRNSEAPGSGAGVFLQPPVRR